MAFDAFTRFRNATLRLPKPIREFPNAIRGFPMPLGDSLLSFSNP